jgi:hypothetical protein
MKGAPVPALLSSGFHCHNGLRCRSRPFPIFPRLVFRQHFIYKIIHSATPFFAFRPHKIYNFFDFKAFSEQKNFFLAGFSAWSIWPPAFLGIFDALAFPPDLYPRSHSACFPLFDGLPMGNQAFPPWREAFPASHPMFPASHPMLPASHPMFPASHPMFPASHPMFPAPHPMFPASHPMFPAPHPMFPASFPMFPVTFPMCPATFPMCPATFPMFPATFPTPDFRLFRGSGGAEMGSGRRAGPRPRLLRRRSGDQTLPHRRSNRVSSPIRQGFIAAMADAGRPVEGGSPPAECRPLREKARFPRCPDGLGGVYQAFRRLGVLSPHP